MLYTRTKRAAAAVLLGIGGLLVAGAASAQTHANSPVAYIAKEALTTTDSVTTKSDKVTYYEVVLPGPGGSGNAADPTDTGTDARLTIPVANLTGLALYPRVNFTNLLVEGQVTAGWANLTGTACTGDGTPMTFVALRNEGRSAVYSIPADTSSNADTGWCIVVQADTATTELVRAGDVKAEVVIYTELRDALYATADRDLTKSETATIARVQNVVTAKVTQGATATAEVDRGFATFTTGDSATLATVSVAAKHIADDADHDDNDTDDNTGDDVYTYYPYRDEDGARLTETTAKALVKSARADFSGDFSVGAFTLSGDDCPGKLDINDDQDELTGGLDGVASCTFTMNVKDNADAEADDKADTEYKPIKAQQIEADLAVVLTTDKPAYPLAALTGKDAGKIERNGTTVHLPYLTAAAGYAQSVVIVNRGAKDADFWIEDLSSNGTDPIGQALSGAPMNIGKESSATYALSELVDLGEGGTSGSATLSVNAAGDNVSVLTMVTNQATGSTDTLQHDPM